MANFLPLLISWSVGASNAKIQIKILSRRATEFCPCGRNPVIYDPCHSYIPETNF